MTRETTSETSPLPGSGPNSSSRDFFQQRGTTAGSSQNSSGTPAHDTLTGAVADGHAGLPGALSFYSFANGSGGSFADLRGGPAVTAYVDAGSSATVAATLRAGPDGSPDSALAFDGKDTFAYVEHSPAWEISQGTLALWVQPDDLSSDAIVLSKDLKGSGDGGHFRLGHEEDGTLFIRFANGDGSGNRAWESSIPYLEEGQWTHLAVSFSAEGGVVVYVDGIAVPDAGWIRTEGNEDLPSLQSEAYLLAKREPWILGADTSRSENTHSPDAFAAEHGSLRDAFDGAIADFGIWGGNTADDVLTATGIFALATQGPGTALTNPAGPQPMVAGASTTTRKNGSLDQLKEFLTGSVSDLVLLDRELTPGETLLLANGTLAMDRPDFGPASTAPGSAPQISQEIVGTGAGETLEGSEGDGRADDTMVSFEPGDSVVLLGLILGADDIPLI